MRIFKKNRSSIHIIFKTEIIKKPLGVTLKAVDLFTRFNASPVETSKGTACTKTFGLPKLDKYLDVNCKRESIADKYKYVSRMLTQKLLTLKKKKN